MSQELGQKYTSSSKQRHWAYWQAYTLYYVSIYHMKMQANNQAKDALKQGIKVLENMAQKSSEDYALLSAMQSFSIAFNQSEAAILSNKALKSVEKALDLDPKNLRAYFVAGRNDFYKPRAIRWWQSSREIFIKSIIFKRCPC